jgi:uncharacterized YokU family protein
MWNCEWCESTDVEIEFTPVYRELPDGTRAIEIEETPTVKCHNCQMSYQNEKIPREIENQLFLIDTKQLGKKLSYSELMKIPKLLKRNYFDFTS